MKSKFEEELEERYPDGMTTKEFAEELILLAADTTGQVCAIHFLSYALGLFVPASLYDGLSKGSQLAIRIGKGALCGYLGKKAGSYTREIAAQGIEVYKEIREARAEWYANRKLKEEDDD